MKFIKWNSISDTQFCIIYEKPNTTYHNDIDSRYGCNGHSAYYGSIFHNLRGEGNDKLCGLKSLSIREVHWGSYVSTTWWWYLKEVNDNEWTNWFYNGYIKEIDGLKFLLTEEE